MNSSAAKSFTVDEASGCRSMLFGLITTSGFLQLRIACRLSRWKCCARRRRLGYNHIVLRRELQKPLQPCARVLRSLAFVPMRKQHHQPAQQVPLRLAGRDELVDNDLRAIREIPELRLPKHQRLGIIAAVSVLISQHRGLAQQRVVHLEPHLVLVSKVNANVFERNPLRLRLRIDQHAMPLVERPALRILPRQSHRRALL